MHLTEFYCLESCYLTLTDEAFIRFFGLLYNSIDKIVEVCLYECFMYYILWAQIMNQE